MKLTAPLDTLKSVELNDATPFADAVASSIVSANVCVPLDSVCSAFKEPAAVMKTFSVSFTVPLSELLVPNSNPEYVSTDT